MKTPVLTFFVILFGIGLASAQDESASDVNLTDQLKSLCRLTPDQIAKVQPIITDFEKKRDDTYRKYRHNPTELKKLVKQNRWDYETSLIGTLNPSQMGLLKVFDQRNPSLMAHASSHVVDVSYFADNNDSQDQTAVASSSSPAINTDVNPTPVSAPIVASSANEQSNTDDILANAIRDFCQLSPNQFAEAQPVLADFEAKRDSIYKLYKGDKVSLNKAVRRNRLNYEVALIDILDPVQMRVLRAFNLSNRQLMSGSGTTVNKVDFIPGIASISDDKHPIIKPIISENLEAIGTSGSNEVAASDNKKQSSEEVNLTETLKELCDLTPEQIAKVDPIIAEFETKRDAAYKKYRHNPTALAKIVKQNRWDYEVSLIGILNPSQMGLLKVFDQRNTELMTFNSSTVVDVSYFADNR